ncbi:hypothetical protein V6N13_014688 [Hibiscus sabdariffa]
MEAPISIVGSICGSIAGIATESAVGPITRQLSYLFKHKTKFQNLRTKVQELKVAAQRVQQSVHQATMNGEEIFDDVEKWLTAVNEKISDQAAAQLEEDEEKSKRREILYDSITEGFPDLKHLRISDVSDIKVVLNYMMSVPCLESLFLCNLTDLGAICDDQLKAGSFERLRIIKVRRCEMKNLFSSTETKLHQLEQIEVFNCDNMIGLIVVKEETGDNEILEFRQLRSVVLGALNSFKSLWYSEKTLESVPCLFDKKVSCPTLEKLYLKSVSGIEKIWNDDQLHVMPFGVQSLERLTIDECHKLKYVFASSMIKSFVQLKTLHISNCGEMDEELNICHCPVLKTLHCDSTDIDTKSGDNISLNQRQHFFNEKVILPVLEQLNIENMDNLERLWPNQHSQHSFSKLTSIWLGGCPKLLDVFPSGMLTRFQRLNQLSIRNCKSVEEIIFESHPQEEKGSSSSAMQSFSPHLIQSAVITFEFSRLTSLIFEALPNLRSTHREMLTINWPSLKEMEVKGCDKVEILFASQETTGFRIQQPLFWVNQFTFPKLHQLTLGWNVGVKETWHSDGQQLVSHHFPNLEVVELVNYTDRVLPPPSYLIPLLSSPNLQTLEIRRCSFQEMMFQSEEGGEEKSAWVRKINLVPSFVSLRNLVTLKVEQCHGIIKLITHSTAKSLVQLREMSIKYCRNIEEIIQGVDNDDDEIHLPQLNHLELIDLPKLESFSSSRNHTFGFPSLQTVIVHKCPKMKMFSPGHSNTPMLHKVWLDRSRNEEVGKAVLIAPYNNSSEKSVITGDHDRMTH